MVFNLYPYMLHTAFGHRQYEAGFAFLIAQSRNADGDLIARNCLAVCTFEIVCFSLALI